MFYPFFLIMIKEANKPAYRHTPNIYRHIDSAERDFDRFIHEIETDTMLSLVRFAPNQYPDTVCESHGLMGL